MMQRIHARLPDRSLVEGVEAFRRVYEALGFRRTVSVTRWPVTGHERRSFVRAPSA